MNALAQAAEDAGYHKLTSRVFTTNQASLALHRAAGFREVGIQRHHGQLDGEWKDTMLVERLLGEAARDRIDTKWLVTARGASPPGSAHAVRAAGSRSRCSPRRRWRSPTTRVSERGDLHHRLRARAVRAGHGGQRPRHRRARSRRHGPGDRQRLLERLRRQHRPHPARDDRRPRLDPRHARRPRARALRRAARPHGGARRRRPSVRRAAASRRRSRASPTRSSPAAADLCWVDVQEPDGELRRLFEHPTEAPPPAAGH